MSWNIVDVNEAISRAVKRAGCESFPDLIRICRAQYIRFIIMRDMFSGGAMEPIPGGFRVYLKATPERTLDLAEFVSEPEFSVRTRFTLAHEIVHTLFYELPVGQVGEDYLPKVKKSSPRGPNLERLCQEGARNLLVPYAHLMKKRGDRPDALSAQQIISLAEELRVSIEVVVRRVQVLKEFNPFNSAQLLIEKDPLKASTWIIIAARCGEWFTINLNLPIYHRSQFARWLKQHDEVEDVLLRELQGAVWINGVRIRCSVSSYPRNRNRRIVDCIAEYPE